MFLSLGESSAAICAPTIRTSRPTSSFIPGRTNICRGYSWWVFLFSTGSWNDFPLLGYCTPEIGFKLSKMTIKSGQKFPASVPILYIRYWGPFCYPRSGQGWLSQAWETGHVSGAAVPRTISLTHCLLPQCAGVLFSPFTISFCQPA